MWVSTDILAVWKRAIDTKGVMEKQCSIPSGPVVKKDKKVALMYILYFDNLLPLKATRWILDKVTPRVVKHERVPSAYLGPCFPTKIALFSLNVPIYHP